MNIENLRLNKSTFEISSWTTYVQENVEDL